mgnify:FL=1
MSRRLAVLLPLAAALLLTPTAQAQQYRSEVRVLERV